MTEQVARAPVSIDESHECDIRAEKPEQRSQSAFFNQRRTTRTHKRNLSCYCWLINEVVYIKDITDKL